MMVIPAIFVLSRKSREVKCKWSNCVPWWVPEIVSGETPDSAAVFHTLFSGTVTLLLAVKSVCRNEKSACAIAACFLTLETDHLTHSVTA